MLHIHFEISIIKGSLKGTTIYTRTNAIVRSVHRSSIPLNKRILFYLKTHSKTHPFPSLRFSLQAISARTRRGDESWCPSSRGSNARVTRPYDRGTRLFSLSLSGAMWCPVATRCWPRWTVQKGPLCRLSSSSTIHIPPPSK